MTQLTGQLDLILLWRVDFLHYSPLQKTSLFLVIETPLALRKNFLLLLVLFLLISKLVFKMSMKLNPTILIGLPANLVLTKASRDIFLPQLCLLWQLFQPLKRKILSRFQCQTLRSSSLLPLGMDYLHLGLSHGGLTSRNMLRISWKAVPNEWMFHLSFKEILL